MVIGWLSGDWATARFRPERLIRFGAWFVVLGLGASLAIGTAWSAMAGFAAVGLGLASFPVLLSVAGRAQPTNPGVAVASVTMMGDTGFLFGPPLLGFLAQILGLRAALGLLVVLWLGLVGLAHLTVLPAADVRIE